MKNESIKLGKIERWNKNYLSSYMDSHIISYPTPSNLSYFWSFGAASGFCLAIQLLTGIFLAMHYAPEINLAFFSTEHIMRDVNYGWILRYLHANGASFFFIVVYIHIFRGLYYGSYMQPRESIWCSGILIFFLMIITAFMGYVLPWGQMSFWAATVITNLFSAIPYVGGSIVEWLWGGFSVDNPTLNRFLSFHFILPFIIVGVVILHFSLLHRSGSNNPLGLTKSVTSISFYPYFYVKDLLSFFILLILTFLFIIYYPGVLGHPDNYIVANPLVTPTHIVPEWYFLPFYAILRSIPNKLGGVITMVSSILVLFLLPFITSPIARYGRFRFFYKIIFWFLVGDFILLGWIGQKPAEEPYNSIGLLATLFYLNFFIIFLPTLEYLEKLRTNNLQKYLLYTFYNQFRGIVILLGSKASEYLNKNFYKLIFQKENSGFFILSLILVILFISLIDIFF